MLVREKYQEQEEKLKKIADNNDKYKKGLISYEEWFDIRTNILFGEK